MSEISNADVAEWVVSFWKQAPSEIAKGGPGSGEGPGHPFRGNRYTGGVQSAGHHEMREHSRGWGHGQHMTGAAARIAAGRVALAHGDHGQAREHFNEAAFHASQASSQIAHGAGSRELGHHAEALYHAAHHAGDAAEKAGYLTNRHGEAIGNGRETTVVTRDQLLNTEAGRAVGSTSNFDRGGRFGPVDTRLIPEGRSTDRVLTTAELSNAAQGARDNAERAANLAGAASHAATSARGLMSPTAMGRAAGQ